MKFQSLLVLLAALLLPGGILLLLIPLFKALRRVLPEADHDASEIKLAIDERTIM